MNPHRRTSQPHSRPSSKARRLPRPERYRISANGSVMPGTAVAKDSDSHHPDPMCQRSFSTHGVTVFSPVLTLRAKYNIQFAHPSSTLQVPRLQEIRLFSASRYPNLAISRYIRRSRYPPTNHYRPPRASSLAPCGDHSNLLLLNGENVLRHLMHVRPEGASSPSGSPLASFRGRLRGCGIRLATPVIVDDLRTARRGPVDGDEGFQVELNPPSRGV